MGKSRDIQQIEAVAREFGMTPWQRREFGDYVEDRKRMQEKGSRALAKEFLEEQ